MPKDANDTEGNATGRWLKRLKRSVAGAPEDKNVLDACKAEAMRLISAFPLYPKGPLE